MVDSLVTCLESPTDQVSVLVRGYASSSGPDSDNDALYKDREALVAKLISDRVVAQGKSSQFTVEVRDWKSLQIMKMRRLFKDTDEKGTYLLTAGALNRRAEIRVRAAGACLPG